MTATHYEKAVSLIESHWHAVDSNLRDPEWEQQLLHPTIWLFEDGKTKKEAA